MTTTLSRKPAGGVVAVTLSPAGNLLRAEASGGGVEVTFRDERRLVVLPLAEERSSYGEEADTQAGPMRIKHLLTLAVNRELASECFSAELLQTAATEGLLAIVTMASGERLLAGWSAKFGTSQSLRTGTVRMASGQKALDGTWTYLTLGSEDTAPASELKE